MPKVIVFAFDEIESIIQCDDKEQIVDVYKKYISKVERDISNINFIYDGKNINGKLSFNKIANVIDKKRNIINISLESKNKNIINENNISTKDIICPICNESIILKIKDYKIFLSDCINGHKLNNILLNEYEKSQNINIKMICDICKKTVKNFNNLNICYSCKMNLCSKCKSSHAKNHIIINYEKKNYICSVHNKDYIEYCKSCKKNICYSCKNEHKKHDIIYYEDIIPKKFNMKKEINELKLKKDKLYNNINCLIQLLNKIMNNIEIYYKITNNVYNNYINNYKNYHLYNNVYEFKNYNKIILGDINNILETNNSLKKLKYLTDINNRMENKIYEEKNLFKKNPNFEFKSCYFKNALVQGINDIFELFISYKDKKEYLVLKDNNNDLEIITLLDSKKITSLKGHENTITSIRYFFNDKNFYEYLISTDNNKVVIIWDITNNYNNNYRIQTKYNNYIYSSLLVFPHYNNENYIVTSTVGISDNLDSASTKLYSLNNCKFVKNIINTNRKEIYYLLSWYNKNSNKYYVIQFANREIAINDLIDDNIYSIFQQQPEGKHYSGIIYTVQNKDYLCTSTEWGNINIWDLYDTFLFKVIKVKENSFLMKIIQWNNKYIIVVDYNSKSFKIIDLELYKVITEIKEEAKSLKKIEHPIFGETLLTIDFIGNINLWTIK